MFTQGNSKPWREKMDEFLTFESTEARNENIVMNGSFRADTYCAELLCEPDLVPAAAVLVRAFRHQCLSHPLN